MEAITAFVWYMVIAAPQGGMVIMPSAFDTHDDCANAIVEYQKHSPAPGWTLQCIPSPASFLDDGFGAEEPNAGDNAE